MYINVLGIELEFDFRTDTYESDETRKLFRYQHYLVLI